ncbi:MAG: NADH-quinone oxidoreductase subunit J [Anaerolineaceae bacterium]|nr:NADH-quinone oxidoreductase subunit J [Anaerolineaceae bacterium]
MWQLFVVIGICICAFEAIQSRKLTHSALWLALTSAMAAWLIFLLGAPEIAVIELSVGAGVVTILLVFAINIVGDVQEERKTIIPKPIALFLVVAAITFLGSMLLPLDGSLMEPVSNSDTFSKVLWEDRIVDSILQIVLIFACVLGVLSLLEERGSSKKDQQS